MTVVLDKSSRESETHCPLSGMCMIRVTKMSKTGREDDNEVTIAKSSSCT